MARVWLLSKNLANGVEIELLAKYPGRNGGNVRSVWNAAVPQHIYQGLKSKQLHKIVAAQS